jgi:hypothetical protein
MLPVLRSEVKGCWTPHERPDALLLRKTQDQGHPFAIDCPVEGHRSLYGAEARLLVSEVAGKYRRKNAAVVDGRRGFVPGELNVRLLPNGVAESHLGLGFAHSHGRYV